MKNSSVLCIILMLLCGIMISACVPKCVPNQAESKNGIILGGNHKLYPLKENSNTNCYIVISNGLGYFKWSSEKNIMISTLPIKKIIFNCEDVENPYIKFKWIRGEKPGRDSRNDYEFAIENVIYAVICSKDNPIPPIILEKEESKNSL